MKELLREFLRKNIIYIVVQLIGICIHMYLLTYPAKMIGNIVDLFKNPEANSTLIMQDIFMLMGVTVLLVVVGIMWGYLDKIVPRKLEKVLREKLFSHFLKINISEVDKIKNGEMMSYFVKDIGEMKRTYGSIFSLVPRIVFTFIFASFAMVQDVDMRLTLVSLSPIVMAIFLLVIIKQYINKNYEISQMKFTSFSEFLQEATDAIRTTKLYQLEEEQVKKFSFLNQEVKDSNIKVNFFSSLLAIVIHTCFGISYGIAILFGGSLILENKISVGEFVAFHSYIALFIAPVSWIPILVSRIKRGQVSFARLKRVFHLAEEVSESNTDQIKKVSLIGDVKIQDLSFHYQGYADTVLHHINLEVLQGQTIGIIGRVGSGKSTLMNLLVKLYAVKRGEIMINGIDICDIDVTALRESICYITQENFLFSTTIKENINLFRDDYEEEELSESVKDAMIYDEVMQLPEKLNTVVGERGIDLSGGQKQRVVISRAFLNNSDIIIFDDTFSALDNKTEQHLLKNIKKLTKGKTCFIVSNRISDIKHADNILVLDAGEIVECGTHQELMSQKNAYYQFHQEQANKKEESILS